MLRGMSVTLPPPDLIGVPHPHVVTDLHTRTTKDCWVVGPHVIVAMGPSEVLLCRSRIRGWGPCYTEVPFNDDGSPPSHCPRCKQPMPWFGTMEVQQ